MGNIDLASQLDQTQLINCHAINTLEDCQNILNDKFKFKVLTFNIRSLRKNFDSFLIALRRLNTTCDVIILTECWLDSNSIIGNIPGYSSFSTQRNLNQNGGVVAYVRDIWSVSVTETNIQDACGLLINIANFASVLGIYRSPSFKNLNNFILSLDNTLRGIKGHPNIILAGDININILSTDCKNLDNSEYLCVTAAHGFLPAITLPTRLNSCIDHIFIKSSLQAVSVVGHTDITDHKMVFLGLANEARKKKPLRTKTKINIEEVINELKDVDWAPVFEETGVNEATNSFLNILSTILLKHTREIKISRSKAVIKPWITPGLLRCIRHRDRLHLLARNQPNNNIVTTSYSRYRNFCNDLLRKLKTEYESNELEKNQNNSKALWNTVKEICHLKKKHVPPTELLTTSENFSESLLLCNNFFASVGKNLADKILTEIKKTEDNLASKVNVTNGPINSFFLSPTDPIEVDTMITSLKNNSAPGLDGLTNDFIKLAKKYIICPLTYIFNLSFKVGIFPDAWKVASITPVHKGGSKSIPNNYRPISLLSGFSKVLEKITNKRLTDFLERNGLLSENQYGFRRLKSTEDAAHNLINHVAKQLDKGQSCVGVFLDLAKAFDTVSMPILFRKLERIGIRGTASQWLQSYLSKREQLVTIEGLKSTAVSTYYGVPQGSILGPLLFIIYMNDIHDLHLPSAEITCYADDTAIVFSGANWKDTMQVAERGLQQVCNWLQNNLLTLNRDKTKYICFHKTVTSQPPPLMPDLKIHSCNSTLSSTCHCNQIQRTKEIKYLGLILDERLNFASHIETLGGRVRKLIGIFKILRNSASFHILKLVYFALCQSLLSYCIGVWGGAGKTLMLPLERAQRAILKVMLRKDFRFSTDLLYKEAGVLRVRQLYIHKACVSTHKSIIKSSEYRSLLTKRVFNLSLPLFKSSFVKKFQFYAYRSIYNNVNKLCGIKNCSVHACSKRVMCWLQSIDYDTTENIISGPIQFNPSRFSEK